MQTERSHPKRFTGHALRGLAWGEVFICLGIHFFWVLGKGWPLAAETALGAGILVGSPLAVVLAAALLMRIRSFKEAILSIEWVLHLSAAASFFVLLAYLTLRDPFNPWLPYTSPLCLWSVGIGFVLLANMTTHERRPAPDELLRRGHLVALAALLWCALLLTVSGMTWPAFFWTAMIVLHAFLALSAARSSSSCSMRTGKLPSSPLRIASGLEACALIALLLLAQLHLIFASTQTGTLELKYVETLDMFTSPVFFAGAVAMLVAARLGVVALTHIAVGAAIILGVAEASWPIHLVVGYVVVGLFRATHRLGSLGYVLTGALVSVVWMLGQLGYGLAGLILNFEVGLPFVEQLIKIVRVAAPILLGLWLVVSWWAARRVPAGEPPEDFPEIPQPRRWAQGMLYSAILCMLLLPTFAVMAWEGWYPRPIERAVQTPIEEPFGVCHAGYSGTDEEYEVLKKLGVRLMRVDFAWSGIQPSKDTWDFSRWDTYLDAAERNGMRVLALLDFDNNTVETSPVGSKRPVYIAPEDIPLFLEYVRRTVGRFKDRVYAWEIWNEPDMARFWQGTEEEFYELARRTADTVREVAPSARLIGTAMTGPLGAWTTPMLEGMHTSGALKKVDHPACHLYISDPRAYYNEYSKVLAAAKKHGHPGAPWVTETGDPDGGTYSWRASPQGLAEHVIKSHTIVTSLGIDTVVWYCFRDSSIEQQERDPKNSEGFFGLIERDGQWKPAAYAYRLFSEHCGQSTLREDLVQVRGGLGARQLRTALYRRENGESALILWFEPMLRPAARARVYLDLGRVEGTPMIHDIGSSYTKLLLDDVVDVSEKPVFITFKAENVEEALELTVKSSPADALWLLLLAGLLVYVFIASRASIFRKGATPEPKSPEMKNAL